MTDHINKRRGCLQCPIRANWLAGAFTVIAGCMGEVPIPDQSQFEPLESLRFSGTAVVRLYVAPIIPGTGAIATHSWFVVKRADSATFHRWEVWRTCGGPYGHVRENMFLPTAHIGAGGVYVLAELIGSEAEPVVAFVEGWSPTYPCRSNYLYFPGLNSNTYAQWVLENTGWNVVLPARAIGQHPAGGCSEDRFRTPR